MMWQFWILVAAFGAILCQDETITEQEVKAVTGIAGTSVSLPCPLHPKTRGDKPKLILWYKKHDKNPLYSYDIRKEKTPYLMNSVEDPPQSLILKSATLSDVGIYECRVDFFQSPTHTNLVNLTVIKSPTSVEIFDKNWETSREGVVGPYQEGDSVILTCLSRGGYPRPNITWWDRKMILNSTSPAIEIRNPIMVESDLFLQKLDRSWFNKTLTCSSSNSQLLPPVTSSVRIQLYLFPTSVTLSQSGAVREGKSVKLRCIAKGSVPAPKLTWLVNGKPINGDSQHISKGAMSSSLTFNVTRDDNGKKVTCKASNPSIPDSSLTNSTTLVVHYPPTAKAILGESFRPALLKEGDDVYFVCKIDSNPPAENIQWFHKGKNVVQNISDGVIIAGNSLVLQKVKRNRTGVYTCSASNTLATVTSSPVELKLRYKPECSTAPATYFIYDRPINVTCSVTSHPVATRLHWRWDGGSDILNVRPFNADLEGSSVPVKMAEGGATGTLTVNPSRNSEDRELSCWGVNDMGSQIIPCSFAIKVAKIPAPLSSCRLANITASSLSLSCQQADPASIDSTMYRAELYLDNNTIFANVSSNRPHFRISRLDPGTSYQIKVYVSRGPVTSEPVVVSASTFRRSRVEASTSGTVHSVWNRCLLGMWIIWLSSRWKSNMEGVCNSLPRSTVS